MVLSNSAAAERWPLAMLLNSMETAALSNRFEQRFASGSHLLSLTFESNSVPEAIP